MLKKSNDTAFWILAVLVTGVSLVVTINAQQNRPGLIVEEVVANSTAAKAAIKVGDRILSYDNKELTSPAAFLAWQENTFGKKEVELSVQRNEETLGFKVPIGVLGVKVRPELSSAALKLYEEANTALQAQKSDEAIAKLKDGARASEATGDKSAATWLRGRAAELYEGQRQWKEAITEYEAALELLKESRDDAARSRTMFALGRCRQNINEFSAAEQWVEQARQVDLAAGYEMWVAGDFYYLGYVAHKRGALQVAQDYHVRSLAIEERLAPNSLNFARSLNNLGLVAFNRGDLQSAQYYLNLALEVRERLAPNSLDVAGSLNNLGVLASDRGDLPAAQDYYSRALAIRERLEPVSSSVAGILSNLGILTQQKGDLQAAQDYYRRALAIDERLTPNSLTVASSLNDLGNVTRLKGDLQAAHDYYNRALAIRERLAPNSLRVVETLNDLGDIAFRERRFNDARGLFARGVNIIEDQRSKTSSTEARALILARYAKLFTGLLSAHLQLNDWPAAFATSERARARSLVEMLAERRLDLRSDAPAELLEQQDALDQKRSAAYSTLGKLDSVKNSNQIEQLQTELGKYDLQQRELAAQIRRASPKLANLQYPEPLNLLRTQAEIEAGTLLLSYYVDDRETYLFAVTKDSLKLFRLPVTEKDLNTHITEFQNQLSVQRLGNPIQDAQVQGQKLYATLIGPAQDLVNRAKRVLICPDGPLQTLPFAALVSRLKPQVRYFIDDKPLHTIVSMTVYAETRKTKIETARQLKTVLAFGDPIYAREQVGATNKVESHPERVSEKKGGSQDDAETDYLRRRGLKFDERLPQTRKEVEEIGKLFGKSATLRLDKEATETAARQESKDYAIVHFAVHGWLDEKIGLNSGLVLSRPELVGKQATKDDNGLLQAWEILEQVRFKADLVVLSACETGLGQRLRGEGLIGLTRAIQYAGARSIVVTLWGVNDESTAALMRAFYEELKKGASKDVALQKATATVRRNPKWSHPFYWSPFVLVGSWN